MSFRFVDDLFLGVRRVIDPMMAAFTAAGTGRSVTGPFITTDGPGGSGKTATVAALAGELRLRGHAVQVTAEPSARPVGTLTRALVNEVAGYALACLVAADLYRRLNTEIRPERTSGRTVICDRYLASTLVLQARDGLTVSYLLALNQGIDLPDLAVILTASTEIITARLDQRERHDRFEHDPGAASTETASSGTPPRPSPTSACLSSRSTPASSARNRQPARSPTPYAGPAVLPDLPAGRPPGFRS